MDSTPRIVCAQPAFVMALMFINLYPNAVQTYQVLSCGTPPYHTRCDENFFKRWVVPTLVQLSLGVNYVDYGRRWCHYNHVPLLPSCFTVVLDTYPVVVWEPLNRFLANALYQPKYGSCVFKVVRLLYTRSHCNTKRVFIWCCALDPTWYFIYW